jgi:hypothetical protein
MARTPPPKRKAASRAPAKPAIQLRGQRQQITITLPPDLVAELDAITVEENRSRAKQIEVALRQFVQSYRHKAATP